MHLLVPAPVMSATHAKDMKFEVSKAIKVTSGHLDTAWPWVFPCVFESIVRR